MEKISDVPSMTWTTEPHPRGRPMENTSLTIHTHPNPIGLYYTNTLGGGEAERVAESGIYPGGFPAWSPDGTEIAFVSGNPTEWRIRIINLKTREQETFLPKTLGSHIHYPAWSPDGKHIAFALRKWGAKSGIYNYSA